jgi:hypothetical protein
VPTSFPGWPDKGYRFQRRIFALNQSYDPGSLLYPLASVCSSSSSLLPVSSEIGIVNDGSACFELIRREGDSAELEYSEKGTLNSFDLGSFDFHRNYLYTLTSNQEETLLAISFQDKRPLISCILRHAASKPDGTWRSGMGMHTCGSDLYHSVFEISDCGRKWWSLWMIKGPRKNHIIWSEYAFHSQ